MPMVYPNVLDPKSCHLL
uniref:Uncharacterized protein n=1 Tax=Arundo donax TaxID=35708 RepID=A0A0A9TJ20_ARUDO